MPGLWRFGKEKPEGKYLVTRRDGTVPDWPSMVFGARDPAAPAGLRAYADKAEQLEYDPPYVADVRRLADEFESVINDRGAGNPCSPAHRKDDPPTIEKMKQGKGA